MTLIEILWQTLRQKTTKNQISEGEFTLVLIDPTHPFEIYAGLDGAGSVMLAMGISQRPPAIDADTDALNYIRVPRAGGSWIMALRMSSSGLEQVFGRLCQDLIDAAMDIPTESMLISLFRERLLLWKRLFQHGFSGLLQKFQVKGLIAELLALETFLLLHQENPLLPLLSWVGPSGADQDFLFADRAVEIKSVSPGAEKVNISSATQLFAEVPLELHLYILREGSQTEPGAINLPDLVNRLEQRLIGQQHALKAYRSKLIEAGYVEHENYQGMSFTLMEIKRFTVSKDFPRLVRPEMSDAITDVTYSLVLSSISQFQVLEKSNAT